TPTTSDTQAPLVIAISGLPAIRPCYPRCRPGRRGRSPAPLSRTLRALMLEAPAMKRLFYASAAILMLSLAFHFGYTTARAQAPGNSVTGIGWAGIGAAFAVTANGDTYEMIPSNGTFAWTLVSNVFGGPTPALHESWGQLKSRYAPSHAPTSSTPTDR